jgi:plasmid stabilization system protein ParE
MVTACVPRDVYDGWANHKSRHCHSVVDRINETVGLLRRHPYMGRPAEMKGRRELVVDEYIVTYQVKQLSMRIITVEHGSRRT